MQFDYFDALSGEPIPMYGVGHIKSPILKELCPTGGIGFKIYNIYINYLSWDKEKLLQYNSMMRFRGADKLDRESLNAFDVATLLKPAREFCREVLSFFMLEELAWNDATRRFVATRCVGENKEVVGEITHDNFDEVRKAMLQMNFIGLSSDDKPVSHQSEKARELWERSQKYLKKQAESEYSKDKPEFHLGNIISKLCSVHPSYNLMNVFGLTVFQLYDAFFQAGYIRSMNLSERIFSNHGGESFNFEDWLKPILKNV